MKTITIHQNDTYKELGDLYGLFFEDINHAADGGLYAELIQNRSFEYCETDHPDYNHFTGWDKSANMTWSIETQNPMHPENKHYLKIHASNDSQIINNGYTPGIYIEKDKTYDFSIYIRTNEANKNLKINIISKDNTICAENSIEITPQNAVNPNTLPFISNGWLKYDLELTAIHTSYESKLVLTFDEGEYDIDMVSLFPTDTFMGKKGGLRRDIAEALKEMKPKFMRFPGGCLTHDGSLNDTDRDSMYRWKRTLGPIETRPAWRNNWRYNQTLGIGYYEYFCLCEDIGAKPLPVLPGGFNPHKGIGVPIEDIDIWVQEALDLIEFANGDVDTKWGKIRSDMGHSEPFNMEYIGIGNEEIGDGFFERYPYFHNAIREKYPDIKIINTAGPFAVGEGYDAGWNSAKKYGSDMVDEHYYSSPEWFLANMHHYDDFDENGPKVFLGEYASWGNTFYNALVEAAYMTHLEKAKAVSLACYAPMLCNVNYVNWKPDMLWFNNHTILKTPNYHVQKMFMLNQGTDAVKYSTSNLDEIIPLTDDKGLCGGISIAGNDICGKIWDVSFTDNHTHEKKTLADIVISTDNKDNLIIDTDSNDYKLEFSFKRYEGRKGLKIYLGKKNEHNAIQWEFGGWDNWDCNLTSIVNDRGSTISHRIFHVEDIEYRLCLEVKNRHIRTYVNGVLYNDTVDTMPELEELYITSSIDKNTHETILKVVNLTGEAKNVTINLEGEIREKAHIMTLVSPSLSAENTFDNPNNISISESKDTVNNNTFNYTFEAHSVNTIRFAR